MRWCLLQKRVVGQPDAVSAVSKALRRAQGGLKDPSRPIAALLFSGPTGVGKTELTRVSLRSTAWHVLDVWNLRGGQTAHSSTSTRGLACTS